MGRVTVAIDLFAEYPTKLSDGQQKLDKSTAESILSIAFIFNPLLHGKKQLARTVLSYFHLSSPNS
jgi:hypothetical protein